MRSKVSFLSLALCILLNVSSQENPLYVYPVAVFESAGIPHLLVLCQWQGKRLELYEFNTFTCSMNKTLTSWYTPAGIQLLPDLSGFSFVDNGRIRIKRFAKRAVKSLDIYEPIYGIELVKWLDCDTCYFHALSQGHYGIYMLTLDETLTCLASNIVGDTLFFIEYKSDAFESAYTLCTQSLTEKPAPIQKLMVWHKNPHILLHMRSADEGYIIEYVPINNEYHFNYVQLIEDKNIWKARKLFSFIIPEQFLSDGVSRVYESFLPFIPRHQGAKIYFSTYDKELRAMGLYTFDKNIGNIDLVVKSQENLFVPIIFNKKCWYGGEVAHIGTLDINS
ncbi:MAG TPA: hypothetical protein PKD74_01515 [Candidatus Dependentiae bacterium]|nr:hypothetical protein [Candidatus Dependentiae bacterium]